MDNFESWGARVQSVDNSALLLDSKPDLKPSHILWLAAAPSSGARTVRAMLPSAAPLLSQSFSAARAPHRDSRICGRYPARKSKEQNT